MTLFLQSRVSSKFNLELMIVQIPLLSLLKVQWEIPFKNLN